MRDELYSNVFHPEKHNLHQHSNCSFDSSTNVPANQIAQLIHSYDIHSLYLFCWCLMQFNFGLKTNLPIIKIKTFCHSSSSVSPVNSQSSSSVSNTTKFSIIFLPQFKHDLQTLSTLNLLLSTPKLSYLVLYFAHAVLSIFTFNGFPTSTRT